MSAHHKWCDVYQESLVSGRNYFRRVLGVFIIIVAYQSYCMGMPAWAAILGSMITWGLLRFGGRTVQDRHYHSAEEEWDKTHPDHVPEDEEDEDGRSAEENRGSEDGRSPEATHQPSGGN